MNAPKTTDIVPKSPRNARQTLQTRLAIVAASLATLVAPAAVASSILPVSAVDGTVVTVGASNASVYQSYGNADLAKLRATIRRSDGTSQTVSAIATSTGVRFVASNLTIDIRNIAPSTDEIRLTRSSNGLDVVSVTLAPAEPGVGFDRDGSRERTVHSGSGREPTIEAGSSGIWLLAPTFRNAVQRQGSPLERDLYTTLELHFNLGLRAGDACVMRCDIDRCK